MPEPPADFTSPDAYAHWHDLDLRFQDLDPLGHVTSLSFLDLFETARILFVRQAGQAVDASELGWMLVNLNIDYLAQMHFPGSVRVGTFLERAGRTSITTRHGLFQDQRCTAVLKSTLALVDRQADRATPLSENLRDRLKAVSAGKT